MGSKTKIVCNFRITISRRKMVYWCTMSGGECAGSDCILQRILRLQINPEPIQITKTVQEYEREKEAAADLVREFETHERGGNMPDVDQPSGPGSSPGPFKQQELRELVDRSAGSISTTSKLLGLGVKREGDGAIYYTWDEIALLHAWFHRKKLAKDLGSAFDPGLEEEEALTQKRVAELLKCSSACISRNGKILGLGSRRPRINGKLYSWTDINQLYAWLDRPVPHTGGRGKSRKYPLRESELETPEEELEEPSLPPPTEPKKEVKPVSKDTAEMQAVDGYFDEYHGINFNLEKLIYELGGTIEEHRKICDQLVKRGTLVKASKDRYRRDTPTSEVDNVRTEREPGSLASRQGGNPSR